MAHSVQKHREQDYSPPSATVRDVTVEVFDFGPLLRVEVQVKAKGGRGEGHDCNRDDCARDRCKAFAVARKYGIDLDERGRDRLDGPARRGRIRKGDNMLDRTRAHHSTGYVNEHLHLDDF